MRGRVKLTTSTSLFAWLLFAAAPAAQLQPVVDGSWQAEVAVPGGGTTRLLFEFTTNDGKLIGTLKVGDEPALAIEDGRVRGDGDVITFRRTSETDRMDRTVFVGMVLSDKIVFVCARFRGLLASGPIRFTASRVRQPLRAERANLGQHVLGVIVHFHAVPPPDNFSVAADEIRRPRDAHE